MMYDGAVRGTSAGARIEVTRRHERRLEAWGLGLESGLRLEAWGLRRLRAGGAWVTSSRVTSRPLEASLCSSLKPQVSSRFPVAAASRARGRWRSACRLLAVVVAAWRARLEAPAPTLLLRDRHGALPGRGRRTAATPSSATGRSPRCRRAWRRRRSRSRTAASGAIPASTRWRSAARCCRTSREGRRVSGASTLAMQVARMQHPGAATLPRKAVEALTAVFLTARYGRDGVLAPLPAARPLRQPHPRHRLRRAALPRQAGRGPVLGGDRLPRRDPAGAGADEPASPPPAARARWRAGGASSPCSTSGALTTAAEHELALRADRRPAACRAASGRPRRGAAPDPAARASGSAPARPGGRWPDGRWSSRPSTSSCSAGSPAGPRRGRRLGAAGAGNAAVVVVDRASREVLAWVGSTDYFDGGRAGAIDYTAVPRSPGSTLKPFLYALALERGAITPATILDDLAPRPGRHRQRRRAVPRPAAAPRRPRQLAQRPGGRPARARRARRGVRLPPRPRPARRGGSRPAPTASASRSAACRSPSSGWSGRYTVLAGDGRLGELRLGARRGASGERRRVLSEDDRAPDRPLPRRPDGPAAQLPAHGRLGVPVPGGGQDRHLARVRDAWTVAFSAPLPRRRLGRATPTSGR